MNENSIGAVTQRILSVYANWSKDTTIDEMRSDFTNLCRDDTVEADINDLTIEGIPCRWISAPGQSEESIFLYLHGGGFQLGSLDSHTGLTARISAASGMRGLVVDYRLAPEHKFPAALDDVYTVYNWLIDQGFTGSDITLCGDSAGGGLCLSLMASLVSTDQPLPAGAALLSPWTDLTLSGDSYDTRSSLDPLNHKSMLRQVARSYLGRTGDPLNSLTSPLFANHKGLPPLLIQVGDHEVVLDDSIRLAKAVQNAGVDVQLEVAPYMIHVYQLYADDLVESRRAIDRIGGFLRKCIA